MNILFVAVFVLCTVLICAADPAAFLPAILAGGQRAVALCVTLAAVYAVWLGILRVAEDAGALRGMARGLRPLTRRLFRTENDRALERIAVNLSANLLGMGGAATPAGISAMHLLGQDRNEYARAMLFAVNCAGLQIFPTTVVSLRAASGAASAYDVVLPVLLSSLTALLLGVGLVWLIYGRASRVRKRKNGAEIAQSTEKERCKNRGIKGRNAGHCGQFGKRKYFKFDKSDRMICAAEKGERERVSGRER